MYNDLIVVKYAWKRFVFDEPGRCKSFGMKEIKAGFFGLLHQILTLLSLTTKAVEEV